MKIPLVLVMAMIAASCASGGGGETDAGDGGVDAGDAGNGDVAADEDLGDAYGLRIPAGMQACASGNVFTEDLTATLEMIGRVTFKPGLYRLPRDEDSFELDLVERVEWNKEPQEGSPASAGTVSREGKLYTFIQEFDFGSRTMQLMLRVSFEYDDGVVELNDRNLLDWRLQLEGSVNPTSLYFMPCCYDLFDHGVYEYTMQGGDTLTIEACNYCQLICKSSVGAIQRAEVVLGGASRTVEDPMQLALWFGQHDWYGAALVYLPEPLNGVSALVLTFGTLPELAGSTIDLADSALQLIETRTVTATERRPDW